MLAGGKSIMGIRKWLNEGGKVDFFQSREVWNGENNYSCIK